MLAIEIKVPVKMAGNEWSDHYDIMKRHGHTNEKGFVPSGKSSPKPGDDRLRRERLVPECEPRGADLVKPAQKIKCQSHFLRRNAPRCLIRGRE
jgi:hypothetical protein